jgi:hypothetical protein
VANVYLAIGQNLDHPKKAILHKVEFLFLAIIASCLPHFTNNIHPPMTSTQLTRSYQPHEFVQQLLALRETGKSIRLQSPVIQQWPWDNGMPLQHGLMGERMRLSLASTSHEPAFVAMVLVSHLPHKIDSSSTCISST